MKLESLVIADQNAAVPEVSDPTVRRELPKVEPITGVKS